MTKTFDDCRSLAMTAKSQDAVDAWDTTVRSYLGMRRDTGDRLKEVFAADSDMAMAHCLKGYFMLLFSQAKLWTRGEEALKAARDAAEKRPVTDREAAHIHALGQWSAGNWTGATDTWNTILTQHPRDVLALRLAHYTHFYSGDTAAMRDSVARTQYAWDPTVPDYGFVAGCYAFALEEDGDYAHAEQRGREAVGINPADAWSVHAVAHIMEMQGRHAEGIAWLSGLEPQWQQIHNFRYHIWWHRALYHLETGDFDAVLDLYDRGVREDATEDYLDLTNAIALLWRLESEGVDVGERWTEVAERAAKYSSEQILAFIDAHYAIALARTGTRDALVKLQVGASKAAKEKTCQGKVYQAVGVAICDGAIAYCSGDYDRAADRLAGIRYDLWKLGGSWAQRDLFVQMLIEATLKAGRTDQARAMIAERAERRPESGWTRRRFVQLFRDDAGPAGARAAALA